MVVPLRGRNRILGAISFIYADSGRRYSQDDLSFAEDFARRAAANIQNAGRFAHARYACRFCQNVLAQMGDAIAHGRRRPLADQQQMNQFFIQRISLRLVAMNHVHHFVIARVTKRLVIRAMAKWRAQK